MLNKRGRPYRKPHHSSVRYSDGTWWEIEKKILIIIFLIVFFFSKHPPTDEVRADQRRVDTVIALQEQLQA